MARGFLGGILIGGVFSVVVAGVISYVLPLGVPPLVDDNAPTKMAAGPDAVEPVTAPEVTASLDAQVSQAGNAPLADAPIPDSVETISANAITAPPAAPETGQDLAIAAPAAPSDDANLPDLTSDDPVFPNPLSLAPMAPEARDNVDITTEPAQPPAVVVALVDENLPVVDQAPDEGPTAVPPSVERAPATQPAARIGEETAEVPMTRPAPLPVPVPKPPVVAAIPKPAPVPAPMPETETSETEGRPTIGKPAAITSERDTGVTINRLPTALSPEQPADDAAKGIVAGAIARYGQPFANADDKPLMSILLIDEGSDLTGGEVGIAALRSFPYPISFAVDVSLPDAAERLRVYRDEGFEVMAMVDLPVGAQPSDAETTLAVVFSRMPEVVGVLEGQAAGLQPSRDVADQVTGILRQGGFGLVTQDKGLNTMPKLAIKEGVPAAPIFRDFDSKGQTPTVIRRFLDQAAFKAGVEGSVIMLGRMRPETISALLVWGLQDRASQVALAPISAVLLDQTVE